MQGHTLAAVNWIEGDLKALARMEQAKRAGELLAERAKAAGVEAACSTAAATATTDGSRRSPTAPARGA